MVDIKNMAVISKLRVHEKWHQQFIKNSSGWVGVTFIVCLGKGDRRSIGICTTFHRYPVFSKSYTVLCKVYTGYCGTSEIEHGLCACTVDNPLAKARELSLRTGAQTMLYLSLVWNQGRISRWTTPSIC